MLENFSNSESEKEYQRKKQLQRKHPINCDLIDANDLFDKIKIQRNSSTVKGETTNFDLIVPPELMDGNYAQEACALKVGEIFGKRYPYKNNWLKKPHFPYFNRLKLTEFAFFIIILGSMLEHSQNHFPDNANNSGVTGKYYNYIRSKKKECYL